MKVYMRKISSFLLALMLLFSTLSFTLESHYCNDVLVDFSLFGNVESCDMDADHKAPISGCEISKENCCDETQVVIDGQNSENITSTHLTKAQQSFLVSYINTTFHLFEGAQTELDPFRNYRPPLLVRDVQVLEQTFLI